MRKISLYLLGLLLVVACCACQSEPPQEDPDRAVVVVSYLEAGTGKTLSPQKSIAKTADEAVVGERDFLDDIPGYTYLCASAEGEVRAKPGESIVLNRYYVKTDGYYKKGANLIVRNYDALTGAELSPPVLYSKESAFEFGAQQDLLVLEGAAFLAADREGAVAVAQGETAVLRRYYQTGDQPVALAFVSFAGGSGQTIGEPVTVAKNEMFTVEPVDYKDRFPGYTLREDAPAAEVRPGEVQRVTLVYDAASTGQMARVTVRFCLVGTGQSLADDVVLEQNVDSLTVAASDYVKELDGYQFESAQPESVTCARGNSETLILNYKPVETVAQGTATVRILYYLQGTATPLSEAQVVTAENQELTITPNQYVKTITGYTYVSSSPGETVSVQPQETKEIIRYYRKNASGDSTTSSSNSGTTLPSSRRKTPPCRTSPRRRPGTRWPAARWCTKTRAVLSMPATLPRVTLWRVIPATRTNGGS